MSMDPSMLELMTDTVTVEPFVSYSESQAPTFGTAVTYSAQVLPYSQQLRDAQGREWVSMARVIIPDRVAVDIRSRLTLPAGFVPNTPPIRMVRPIAGLDLDSTEIIC